MRVLVFYLKFLKTNYPLECDREQRLSWREEAKQKMKWRDFKRNIKKHAAFMQIQLILEMYSSAPLVASLASSKLWLRGEQDLKIQ